MAAPDLSTQQSLARDIQLQALQDVPYVPLGQVLTTTAYRGLTDMEDGFVQFWSVKAGLNGPAPRRPARGRYCSSAINPAISRPRGARLASTRCSVSVCPPAPTGPARPASGCPARP